MHRYLMLYRTDSVTASHIRRLGSLAATLMMIVPSGAAAESALYVYPETGIYTIGEIFDIKILADTGGDKMSAAEAEMTFNPEALEVQRIVLDESILESWPTIPTFSNQKGTIRFSGWTKTPYAGEDGLLVTVRFKALRNLTSNAYLAAGAILAADGTGSNIITSMKSGLYSVGPQQEVPAALSQDAAEEPMSIPELEEIRDVDTAPAPPEFDVHSMNVEVGERIVVSGKAPANSKVLFFLSKGNDEEKYAAITSDSDGTFTYISDLPAQEGVYRLRASVQDVNGKTSLADRVTITASAHGVAAAVAVSADVVGMLIPLLTLLVLGGLGAGYLAHMKNVEKQRQLAALASRRDRR